MPRNRFPFLQQRQAIQLTLVSSGQGEASAERLNRCVYLLRGSAELRPPGKYEIPAQQQSFTALFPFTERRYVVD